MICKYCNKKFPITDVCKIADCEHKSGHECTDCHNEVWHKQIGKFITENKIVSHTFDPNYEDFGVDY